MNTQAEVKVCTAVVGS